MLWRLPSIDASEGNVVSCLRQRFEYERVLDGLGARRRPLFDYIWQRATVSRRTGPLLPPRPPATISQPLASRPVEAAL